MTRHLLDEVLDARTARGEHERSRKTDTIAERAERGASRRRVVAGALIGIWAGVKIEPGYGSAREREATLDALLMSRRKAREVKS